jgi:regulator of RNase E activity RraA
MMPLDATQLEALRKINTPTIANAIEMFEVRPRNAGFLDSRVRCLFPGMGAMVGYAYTALVSADLAPGQHRIARQDYWKGTSTVSTPRVAVVQDVDTPAAQGSFWGEVNASIHRALGFIGTVTNGGARDLDEMEALKFFTFAGAPSVSHAYIHLIDHGLPVRVGGVVIAPGDLLHGDRHGVIAIPGEIAADVAAAAVEVDEAERGVIGYCRRPDFSVEGLMEAWSRLEARFLEIVERRSLRRR